MNKEYTINELAIMMKNVDQKVNDGFSGTHSRLDTLNNKVGKNTEWRLKSEGSIATMKYIIGSVGLLIIVNIIVSIFK